MHQEVAEGAIPKRRSSSRGRSCCGPTDGAGPTEAARSRSSSRQPGRKMTWADMVGDSGSAPTTSKQGTVVASCSPHKRRAVDIKADDDTPDVNDFMSEVSEAPSNASANDNKAKKRRKTKNQSLNPKPRERSPRRTQGPCLPRDPNLCCPHPPTTRTNRVSRATLDSDFKQARGSATLIRKDISFMERGTPTYKKGLESLLTEIIPTSNCPSANALYIWCDGGAAPRRRAEARRRKARAKAILAKIMCNETYWHRGAYAVSVVDAHGSLVNAATVVTNFTNEAEEMAIAVALQSCTGASIIYSDSRTAISTFSAALVSSKAATVVNKLFYQERGEDNFPSSHITSFPTHMGNISGSPSCNPNERAHQLARELTFRRFEAQSSSLSSRLSRGPGPSPNDSVYRPQPGWSRRIDWRGLQHRFLSPQDLNKVRTPPTESGGSPGSEAAGQKSGLAPHQTPKPSTAQREKRSTSAASLTYVQSVGIIDGGHDEPSLL
ncbi:hypothetical protein HPB52_001357 [Rhipicephalus sanguineus]|uniref:Tick transposon n=1 Tax=Rhipicephalus sanguineus TaxID=34632 RepID=A0A9D4QG46_RHISA|nr:hypothetical protein HPB52_001357 [Rhipicephalus sanguineus]